MADVVQEELSALAAIFCGPHEWEVLSRSGKQMCFLTQKESLSSFQGYYTEVLELFVPKTFRDARLWRPVSHHTEADGTVFRIHMQAEGLGADVPLELVFHLPVSYPACLPGVSVNSERLTRVQCVTVREKLLEQAKNLPPEPMVHELVLWIQQNLKHVLDQPENRSTGGKYILPNSTTVDDGVWVTLLHLDHMRAKTKYVKTVEKWASDLKLTGRLMFMGKLILILLQGDRNNIKEYLILQKTSKVDVDSSGKKCKEKMISVLFETKVRAEHKRFLAFEVKEYSTLDELQKEFETAGLKMLFSELILGLLK